MGASGMNEHEIGVPFSKVVFPLDTATNPSSRISVEHETGQKRDGMRDSEQDGKDGGALKPPVIPFCGVMAGWA